MEGLGLMRRIPATEAERRAGPCKCDEPEDEACERPVPSEPQQFRRGASCQDNGANPTAKREPYQCDTHETQVPEPSHQEVCGHSKAKCEWIGTKDYEPCEGFAGESELDEAW